MEPPQPQTHSLPLTCPRHAHVGFTGFCSSCLLERLRTLDSSSSTSISTARRNSTSTISSSLKSIFSSKEQQQPPPPQLRRCKSTPFEPRRKSRDEIAAPVQVEERPMRDFIELESQIKKRPSSSSRSFWNKIQIWRRKQKVKKVEEVQDKEKTDNRKPSSSRFKETQSEVAIDAFGRRSCDIDRRFSLDAGRISFDQPRASWDGYLMGARSVLHRPHSRRIDAQIPVKEDSMIPGGTAQTKSYYFDSSSRSRRRSMDRSNSIKQLDFEAKQASNAKVSPAGSSEFFRDWSSIYSRDDRSESFKLTTSRQKSKRWSQAWSMWGLKPRQSRGGGAGNENVVEAALSNGHLTKGTTLRRNSSVSSRSLFNGNLNVIDIDGIGTQRRGKFVLEKNQSARYETPGNIDKEMLKFYLTPVRGSQGVSAKGRYDYNCPSLRKSVLQLY